MAAAAVRVTQPDDLPAVANFLTRVYQSAPSEHRFGTAQLEWKYLLPRSEWQASRSFVLEKLGKIVAHCGIHPLAFQLSTGARIPSITLLDWAGDASSPGVGLLLYRKLMQMAPTSFVIGGSPATRQILPRIGFRQVGEAWTYSAWLRPWREFRSRPRTSRSTLRLLHSFVHPLRSREPWTFRTVTQFDDSLQAVLKAKHAWTVCERSVADLNYLLACPYVETVGLLLERNGRLAGYAIIGTSTWEARLLDISVDSDDAEDWKRAVAAIAEAVRPSPEVCRIRAFATIPVLRSALEWNGYWRHYAEPIFVYDPTHELEQSFPIAFQLCDGDSGY